jgi:diguanylate cyclase (GGDEF)-like protein
VTVQASERDEAHGLELGAVDYISKPFNASIVRARVHTHMRLKQQTDLLERYAFLDTLTGTFNRRAFDDHIDLERRRCLRGQRPLSLAMIDVDAFKAFNDGYGHVAGDRCLQRIARALADALHRPGDQLFRYGGEEFAALLPGTDAAGARITAERLRQTVASLAIDHGYYTGRPTVSISVGVDTSRHERLGDHDAVSALVWGADAALYQAKRQGRNQVVVAESIAPPVH